MTAVAAGSGHACAVSSGGQVWCWGSNAYGQLGDGSVLASGPGEVAGITTGRLLASGWRHTCAALDGGGVKCWGDNGLGRLGDGTD